ncbi:Ent-kaurenoic acid oxidase 2 [Camellia lanceoleosa]|uniref:Ent-kaurenoic acid oxidase 2 n=1 Tax=Camellia lanceoleosa TaxID=1840588 RepID=A0ACC0GBZ9_9ERIC|nr:Ent-kaurenoic acid oxidase 2 [Camellia lanceoleosa]
MGERSAQTEGDCCCWCSGSVLAAVAADAYCWSWMVDLLKGCGGSGWCLSCFTVCFVQLLVVLGHTAGFGYCFEDVWKVWLESGLLLYYGLSLPTQGMCHFGCTLIMYLNAGHDSSGHITMWATLLLQDH